MSIISTVTLGLLVLCILSNSIRIRKLKKIIAILEQNRFELIETCKQLCELEVSMTEMQTEMMEEIKKAENRELLTAHMSRCSLMVLRANVISLINTSVHREQYEDAKNLQELKQIIDQLLETEIK